MKNNKKSKYDRILSLYEKLNIGDIVSKSEEANRFGVSERTIQRDIDDIRAFFDNNSLNVRLGKNIFYERARGGYMLRGDKDEHLSESEALAVCKVILESRILIKSEMVPIIDKILNKYTPARFKSNVSEIILNDRFNYCQPQHGQPLLDKLWQLENLIAKHSVTEISYKKSKSKSHIQIRLCPAAVTIRDFYFYLAAFAYDGKEESMNGAGEMKPIFYRLDKIKSIADTGEKFSVPYRDRFNDGEFKQRIQFMKSGRLNTIRFTYSGPSVEIILDRLPTAVIKDEKNGVYTIEAETFGDGAKTWVRAYENNIVSLSDG